MNEKNTYEHSHQDISQLSFLGMLHIAIIVAKTSSRETHSNNKRDA